MAFTTGNMDHLTRSELWSRELKDILIDQLQATTYVRWLSDFPDGNQFTIPTIGQASLQDVVENAPIQYEAFDTGEFNFNITEYVGSATYITRKAMQDSFYANELISQFIPKQRRAIDEKLETDIFALSASQAANDPNVINGAEHRYVGGGANEIIALADFAKAKYALKKANVPMTNLVAIVDPSVGYAIETLTNIVNVSNNPRWEGIIASGMTTGMRFIKNVYGFDVYESNYMADANETIGGITTSIGKANMFFSAEGSVVPFVGAWRQMPIVDSEFNKDLQREEYTTTARYGVKLYRPENLVCVLTDTDQV